MSTPYAGSSPAPGQRIPRRRVRGEQHETDDAWRIVPAFTNAAIDSIGPTTPPCRAPLNLLANGDGPLAI